MIGSPHCGLTYLGMLCYDLIKPGTMSSKMVDRRIRGSTPCTTIIFAAVIRTTVRNTIFYCRTKTKEIIRKIRSPEIGTMSHHTTTDVHTNRSRYDRTLRRYHRPNRSAHSPVNIRHDSHMLVNEGHLCDVIKLGPRLIFYRHAIYPSLDKTPVLSFKYLHLSSLLFNLYYSIYQNG